MTEPASTARSGVDLGPTWRDWHFNDEPCTFSGGCSEPLRSHFHWNPGPDRPVRIVYYDQADYYGGTDG